MADHVSWNAASPPSERADLIMTDAQVFQALANAVGVSVNDLDTRALSQIPARNVWGVTNAINENDEPLLDEDDDYIGIFADAIGVNVDELDTDAVRRAGPKFLQGIGFCVHNMANNNMTGFPSLSANERIEELDDEQHSHNECTCSQQTCSCQNDGFPSLNAGDY